MGRRGRILLPGGRRVLHRLTPLPPLQKQAERSIEGWKGLQLIVRYHPNKPSESHIILDEQPCGFQLREWYWLKRRLPTSGAHGF
jgi:hypothetical protein